MGLSVKGLKEVDNSFRDLELGWASRKGELVLFLGLEFQWGSSFLLVLFK